MATNLTLATRVGISTGIVIVGDLIGTGAAQEAAVVDAPPNLAARLQGLAQPNQVLVSQETQSLLGNMFNLTLVGGQQLKGIAQPVDVFLVNGEKARESRGAVLKNMEEDDYLNAQAKVQAMLETFRV